MKDQELIYGDRRIDRRYTFQLPLHFSYRKCGVAVAGSGTTEDLSSGGIRFVTDNPPPVGVEIELRLEWPFLLQNVCPLELLVWGKVLRSDAQRTVARMSGYEFRTRGARSFDQAAARTATCDYVA
ncbi:MAG: PilZ domain-containing protein [Bryobacteraceae bacterium]